MTANNYSKLTHKQLDKILVELGYQVTKINGSHVAYHHDNPESKILVKPTRGNEIVPTSCCFCYEERTVFTCG